MSKLEERQTESYHVEILYAWYRKSETEGGTAIWDRFCSQRDPIWRNSPYKPLAIFVTVWLVRFLTVFFLSVSQTPWKRKPSERMMGTEEHRALNTHMDTVLSVWHIIFSVDRPNKAKRLLRCSRGLIESFIHFKTRWSRTKALLKILFCTLFPYSFKAPPLYPLTICSEHCLWSELTNEWVQ